MLPWNPSPSYNQGHGPPSSHAGTSDGGAQGGVYTSFSAPNMMAQPGGSMGGHGQQYTQGPPPSFYHGQQQSSPMQQQQQLPPIANSQQQQQQAANGPSQLSPQAPPLSLSQVLHFLQTEFRRHERDKNEWEIERGEMRARIALLEGERRGSENIRADLLRRVKMLEFALRGERSKYLSTASAPAAGASSTANASAIPPAKAAMLKNEDRAASPSGNSPPSDNDGFSDGASQASQPNAASSAASAIPAHVLSSRPSSAASVLAPPGANIDKGATTAGAGVTMGGTMAGTAATASPAGWNPAIGRDPKGRARSRDYLKQCLQEIAYLTSPSTINPLPDRTADGLPRPPPKVMVPVPPPMPPPSAGNALPMQPGAPPAGPLVTSASPAIPTLARNAPDLEIIAPSLPSSQHMPSPNDYPSGPSSAAMEPSRSSEGINLNPSLPSEIEDITPAPIVNPAETSAPVEVAPEVPDRPDHGATLRPLVNGIHTRGEPKANGVPWLGNGEERLTAIFRPDDGKMWKEQIKAAGERAEAADRGDLELAALDVGGPSLDDDDEEERRSTTSSGSGKRGDVKSEARTWRARKTLKNHLDAVRCLAFDRAEMTLASGSDDCTVKVWRMSPVQIAASGGKPGGQPELEPQHTFRGHSGPVTAVAISPSSDRIYSASTDQTVQIWAMLSREREQYSPYDESLRITRLEGHSDAIWSMALVPLRVRDETLLATASADGTVKVWSVEGASGSSLKLSWGYGGTDGEEGEGATDVAPTSVAVVHSDMRKLAVAYQDAVIKLFDIETGRQLLRLRSDDGSDGTPDTQVNMIVTHPTLPLLVSAHEDGNIRFFDLNSGACTHTVLAHSDAVTSVDIDPSGLALASTGHDGSIRIWDLLQTRTCVQEITAHRSKAGEGALAVKYHPVLPFIASAGADGVVKVYA